MDKENIYNKFKRIYQWLDDDIARWGLGIMIGISVFFDLLQCPYWCMCLTEFFDYDIGNVIAIIVVIWTFTVTLAVYCLGKLRDRYFGMQIEDILLRDLGEKGIYRLLGLVLGELIVLIIAAIVEMEITIVTNSVLQVYTVCYIFSMIMVEFSPKNVEEQVERDAQEWIKSNESKMDDNRLLFCMIDRINYEKDEDVEALLNILRGSVARELIDRINFQERQMEENRYVNNCCKVITERILKAGKNAESVELLIKKWFAGSVIGQEGKDSQQPIPKQMKQGILMALVKELYPRTYELCNGLLRTEKEAQRELYIWTIVYNIYLQGFESEGWRYRFTEQMMRWIDFGKEKADEKEALDCWKQSHPKAEKDLYRLFPYIFPTSSV